MTERQGSLAARRASALLRSFVKPRLLGAIASLRHFQAIIERLSPEKRAPFMPDIPGDWTPAIGTPVGATLVYLYGGAFLIGSSRLFRFIARDFARSGFDVFTPDYRLSPEHVFPTALEDVMRAYKALLATRPGPIVLAGDSAGGGLALSLMLRARDEGLPLPQAAALFSPWTDLAVAGSSARENEEKDALFTRRAIVSGARSALGRTSAKNPLASPVYADLSGLPPLIIHAGSDEALRDDSTRLVERARAAGVEVDFELWPEVPHAWQWWTNIIPEARQSRDKAVAFLKQRLAVPAAD
ncbi:alpha/beta hydrolase [Methylocystis sp. MJC1]|jgi:acetyl esterase/lipase|uniref:alpha/beta hydrolase n=1 Tax=Methylocystis sp. MJC1 TaxID=2654282 RepID=UPI0013ECA28B|nr:alpha/beta hydrolase [Methylocystis sp. MJC1]KAF2991942.1 Monoterpene epsilon-lactone hydrolase [Methylocystis sp. MJC1]MBU6525432.1 alpha/beta hydrolase [Methylocystis sp. MJC1]UZX11923.1 alpha/beta hydrolase [Methylocystis sp. MJC1]